MYLSRNRPISVRELPVLQRIFPWPPHHS
jgi:hypothetical protein